MLKKKIRKEKIAIRRALDKRTVSELSEAICKRIISSPEYKNSETIFIYNAVNNEAELSGLRRDAIEKGKRLAYPVCKSEGRMDAYVPEAADALIIGKYGIYEPDVRRSRLIAPENIDLCICPLTAFDGSCKRLGMGGGYYDRYLPKCKNAIIAAAAYDALQVDVVPVDKNDMRMDIVFTESRTIYSYLT